jgi:hypothetical protein
LVDLKKKMIDLKKQEGEKEKGKKKINETEKKRKNKTKKAFTGGRGRSGGGFLPMKTV